MLARGAPANDHGTGHALSSHGRHRSCALDAAPARFSRTRETRSRSSAATLRGANDIDARRASASVARTNEHNRERTETVGLLIADVCRRERRVYLLGPRPELRPRPAPRGRPPRPNPAPRDPPARRARVRLLLFRGALALRQPRQRLRAQLVAVQGPVVLHVALVAVLVPGLSRRGELDLQRRAARRGLVRTLREERGVAHGARLFVFFVVHRAVFIRRLALRRRLRGGVHLEDLVRALLDDAEVLHHVLRVHALFAEEFSVRRGVTSDFVVYFPDAILELEHGFHRVFVFRLVRVRLSLRREEFVRQFFELLLPRAVAADAVAAVLLDLSLHVRDLLLQRVDLLVQRVDVVEQTEVFILSAEKVAHERVEVVCERERTRTGGVVAR
eukprot:31280-Pelagococcus_subviridis.AAC.10